MERKIGEIFEYNGEWHQCIRSITCNGCGFNENGCTADKQHLTGVCDLGRSDGESVIFKKLEKAGEPYIIGNKLIQRYKMYPTTYNINVHGWYYHNLDVKSWTIEIEIKQNKENMEEKKQKLDKLVDDYMACRIQYAEFDKEIKALYDKEESEPTLKEFDLEAAKAGKPVCTRDGRKARIICFDSKNDPQRPIVALVEHNDNELLYEYTIGGKERFSHISTTGTSDLMMLPEKKEGWVNVYRDCDGVNITKDDNIYSSKDAAISSAQIIDRDNYVATTIIKWEDSYDSSNNDTNNIHNCMFYLQY